MKTYYLNLELCFIFLIIYKWFDIYIQFYLMDEEFKEIFWDVSILHEKMREIIKMQNVNIGRAANENLLNH